MERGKAVSTEPFDEPVAQNTASRVAPDPLPDPDADPEEFKKYIVEFKEEAIKAIQETTAEEYKKHILKLMSTW